MLFKSNGGASKVGDLARRVSACVGDLTGNEEDYLKQLHNRQVLSENRQSGRRWVAVTKLYYARRGVHLDGVT